MLLECMCTAEMNAQARRISVKLAGIYVSAPALVIITADG